MVLVVSELSNNALYLYPVLSKYLIGLQSYRPEQQVVANFDGRMDVGSDRKPDPYIARCLRQAR